MNLRTLLFPRPLVLCGLCAAAGLASAQTTAQPSEFAFTFNPPDGQRVTTTVRQQRSRSIDGQPPVVDDSEAATRGTFKRVGPGYEFAYKPVSFSMRRNGSPVQDPTFDLLAKLEPVVLISATGEARDVKGYGGIEALMKSTLPPALAAALAPFLNEAAMVQRERSDWNARYAQWANGRFKIGESITGEAPQELPTGATLVYTVRTTFTRWEACPAGQCVRIEQVYESDATAAAQLAAATVGRVAAAALPASAASAAAAASAPSPEGATARLSGTVSRLVDPKTTLIHAERVHRVLTMQMQLPGGKGLTPVRQEETRTYTHTYE